MVARDVVKNQIPHTIQNIQFDGLGTRYQGKVRDSFIGGDKRILIATDRLSAFDKVLTTIPFKGQILNATASYWFRETANIVPNHLIAEPHPNIFIGREVEIVPIEVVIRGYLTGSAWRDYKAGKTVSGIKLPAGMKVSQRFDKPLITPSTKESGGKHDEPISSEDVVKSGVVEKKVWDEICEKAMALFAFGTKRSLERGLLLVDTKYEFGLLKKGSSKEVVLADEVHTQDSSRYWMADSYQQRFDAGEDPEMLDKEFVRRWLIEQGYMGDGTPPAFTEDFRVDTAMKYIQACEKITGQEFKPLTGPQTDEIVKVLRELC